MTGRKKWKGRQAESAKSTSPMPTKYPHFLKIIIFHTNWLLQCMPPQPSFPLANHTSTRWPGDWDIREVKSANITTITPMVRKQVKPIDPVDGRPITPSRQHRPDRRFWIATSSYTITRTRIYVTPPHEPLSRAPPPQSAPHVGTTSIATTTRINTTFWIGPNFFFFSLSLVIEFKSNLLILEIWIKIKIQNQ